MTMKIAARAAMLALAAATGGCATIIAKSSQTITVTSVPPAAGVSITNAAGVAVHSGTTPMTVTLKKGRGYFKAENYTVRISKEGFQPREIVVRGEVNGWYIGNLLFGGLIGFLAVDPSTGAMYTLKPEAVDAALDTLKVSRSGGNRTLTVVLLEQLRTADVGQLVLITELDPPRDQSTSARPPSRAFLFWSPYSPGFGHPLYEVAMTTH